MVKHHNTSKYLGGHVVIIESFKQLNDSAGSERMNTGRDIGHHLKSLVQGHLHILPPQLGHLNAGFQKNNVKHLQQIKTCRRLRCLGTLRIVIAILYLPPSYFKITACAFLSTIMQDSSLSVLHCIKMTCLHATRRAYRNITTNTTTILIHLAHSFRCIGCRCNTTQLPCSPSCQSSYHTSRMASSRPHPA